MPLCWPLLAKAGTANTADRIAVMERFWRVFPGARRPCLTADREFRGGDGLRFVLTQRMPLRVRIPNNTRTRTRYGTLRLPGQRLFSLRVRAALGLTRPRSLWGGQVYRVGLRLEGAHAILATDQAPATALADYRRRWRREPLWGGLQPRDVNREDTPLCPPQRIERLFALLVVALGWGLKVGGWKPQRPPSRLKTPQRPAQRLFR